MTFSARYPGRCGNCDGQIEPGDLIEFTDAGGVYVHTGCQDEHEHPFDSPYMREVRARPVCAFCCLTKPCGCEDD